MTPQLASSGSTGVGELLEHRRHNTVATSSNMRFWARSVGDRNPRYVDEAYRSPYGGGFEAHPCWLYSVQDTVIPVGEPGYVPIVAGTSWTFSRPVVLGDEVTTTVRLLDEREVNSRFAGPSRLQQVEVAYTDGRGVGLARAVSTLLRVRPEEARKRGKYATWRRWRYAPEQLARIEADYDAEDAQSRRELRYGSNVTLGEHLPPIVRGALTSEEITFFVGATSPVPSQEQFAYDLRMGRAEAFVHPRTGVMETYAAGLVDDESARQLGFPAAHDAGLDRISYMASLVTNWMGPVGQLRGFSVRLVEPHMLGETTWCYGVVRRITSVSESWDAIEVDLTTVNQAETVTATGTAIVELPRRVAATR